MRQHRTRHEVAPLRNYAKRTNGIDFHRLARLADTTKGVTFEKLCERAENGAVTDEELLSRQVVPASKDWITIQDVLFIVGTGVSAWNCVICKHPTALYWGIRAKSRSMNVTLDRNGRGARGCGVLFYRPDIQKLAQIKRAAHLSLPCALKVFFAISEGHITP